MRIKLKKGYQKKLILLSKKRQNLTWKELSKILGISEGYLRNELKNEKTTLSKEIYKKLCNFSNRNFDELIIKELDDLWGKSKGGLIFSKPKLLVQHPSKELAELIGIILGDGNIWSKKGYYYIKICGDSEKDREYLTKYVNPLFEKLFGQKMNVFFHKTNKEIFLSRGKRDIVFTLKHFGLKSGNKKKNNQGIPKWVFKSEDFLKHCIRGLIDTDGCLCPITGRDYPYIWFSSIIPQLRKDFDLAMKKLRLKNSKWNIRKERTPETYIGNKKDIQEYIETISFKNQRHLSKLCPRSTEAKSYFGVKSI